MTTLLFLFILALGFSLVLTPLAKNLGIRLGAVDVPSERKVHTTPIPIDNIGPYKHPLRASWPLENNSFNLTGSYAQ
jgi:hypothetical protein